jgi:hypothetical protein
MEGACTSSFRWLRALILNLHVTVLAAVEEVHLCFLLPLHFLLQVTFMSTTSTTSTRMTRKPLTITMNEWTNPIAVPSSGNLMRGTREYIETPEAQPPRHPAVSHRRPPL